MSSDATHDHRDALESERDRLVGELADLGHGDGILPSYDSNFADTSQVTAERGEAEALATELADTLAEVQAALGRLDAGTYGTCLVCGSEISAERLDALPMASTCIAHAAG